MCASINIIIVVLQLSKAFPNSSVRIHLISTGVENQPRFTMLPGDLQGHLAGMAYYSVKTNTTDVPLFKARVVRSDQIHLCQYHYINNFRVLWHRDAVTLIVFISYLGSSTN